MFEKKSALFLYCTSPVHMGGGTALGAIDNPIQRERHTGHPTFAGSGLKGALRHTLAMNSANGDTAMVSRVFGPPPSESGDQPRHAGALSLADAQLVLFPVRSLRRGFVYATSPLALARLARMLRIAGVNASDGWTIPKIDRDGAVAPPSLSSDGDLILEAFEAKLSSDGSEAIGAIATWLADHAIPAELGGDFFRSKMKTDLIVLDDERFGYFVRNATVVEPHVRIDDVSGTADDGGLFYTECLPPESLLVSLIMVSRHRPTKGERSASDAEEIVSWVHGKFDGHSVQIGGDATTGRGHVLLRFAKGA